MYKEVKPTKEQFEAYVIIQRSGVTNMLDVKVVEEIADSFLGVDLTKAHCLYIYKHYEELLNEYHMI